MGLDIYLYDGPEPDYEADHDAWKAAFDATQDTKSPNFPDHLCGPRYLRSSYNGSGYDRVVHNLLGVDLEAIFMPDLEAEDGWRPTEEELRAARLRAEGTLERLEKAKPLAVIEVSGNVFSEQPTSDERGALLIASRHLDRPLPGHAKDDGAYWYSNIEGEFFLGEPLKVLAAIPGKGSLGNPAVHLVYERDLGWYLDMTRIVIEFIDAALAMDAPRIHWSG